MPGISMALTLVALRLANAGEICTNPSAIIADVASNVTAINRRTRTSMSIHFPSIDGESSQLELL